MAIFDFNENENTAMIRSAILSHERHPHLTVSEWEALPRMSQITVRLAVEKILRHASVESQHDEIQRFLDREICKHTLATPANRGGIKIDVKEYDGSEAMSLLRLFCEMDQAIIARQYTDERI
uniref:AlNc14C352G10919 protein n=1 Tax=Albugo laibachii Nc14 TaxID=890382 RepID=F0WXG8_9STRA|nr:AlNc14C352G10919 [Albugo laibachii Nc14]|eukprot:CCA26161.1 AlNc14C352G10919 [Albugo laibachii Nc14]